MTRLDFSFIFDYLSDGANGTAFIPNMHLLKSSSGNVKYLKAT